MLSPRSTLAIPRTHALSSYFFFFFNDTATTEIYTLSLHDALPISIANGDGSPILMGGIGVDFTARLAAEQKVARLSRIDRKSTRLNSSHANISYAVFCLKKKKKQTRSLEDDTSHKLYIPYDVMLIA